MMNRTFQKVVVYVIVGAMVLGGLATLIAALI